MSRNEFGILNELLEEDFSDPKWFHGLPIVLWGKLDRSDLVSRIRSAIRDGDLTEEIMSEFADHLLKDLEVDHIFEHTERICALAVALQGKDTEYARSFLEELASIECRELLYASYVAKKCLS